VLFSLAGQRVFVAGHRGMVGSALVRRLMQNYSGEQPINVGWGKDVTIAEQARLIAEAVGFKGAFRYASDKPDGHAAQGLDVSRLNAMGWRPRIALREGLSQAYQWYIEHAAETAA
jgi:nucleoside-diphosphate-sugar epimerase